MSAFPTDAPVPDPELIARHVKVLFDGVDGLVPIRLFAEKGTPSCRPKTPFFQAGPGLTQALHNHALDAAQAGVGLFVVPAVVEKAGRATASDIISTAVILVDLDDGDVEAKRADLAKYVGQPSLEVASGGTTRDGHPKCHLYWRLAAVAGKADIKEVCRLRGLLAAKIGGDAAFASPHQPIRVAGSIHGKHGIPSKVLISAHSDAQYNLADLAKSIAAMPALCEGPLYTNGRSVSPPRGRHGFSAPDLMTRRVREGAVDGITRFDAVSKVIGHWIRQMRLGHASLDEAWQAVVEYNSACVVPCWPEDRLQEEFDALHRRDASSSEGSLRVRQDTENEAAASHNSDVSEDALAAAFTLQHAVDWRYVAAWGAWHRWSGTHWCSDTTGDIFELVRQVCRQAAHPGLKLGNLLRLKSDRTIRAVERIARTDPLHSARPEDWDKDAMALNTPAGIVDLRTGEVRAHAREAALTRLTRGSPGRICPQWLNFIQEITNGDEALASYLARVAGYCLSGRTVEQTFFFLHGAGANGKSVFHSVLADVLGDYAATAPLDAFMAGHGERHPTDLAGLRGTRLVVVNETEAGRNWAETKIKAITGGDTLRVRFMHQDFFEFRPTFKLLVAGNHRPRLIGVGEAMRRRLHLVPFEVTIPPSRRDTKLLEKLQAERDGILGWMLAGCAEWQRQGLAPPASIVTAGRMYFEEEDVVGQWIADECQVKTSSSALSSVLFASWSAFSRRNGAEPGSQRELGEALKVRGFEQFRTARLRGWRGIAPLRDGATLSIGEEAS